MFGEKTVVEMSLFLGRRFVSALLVICFAMLSLSISASAQGAKSKPALKSVSKQNFNADIKLDEFRAEVFSGATRISWRTGFEENILGFKIWRENKGERILVNEEMVAGSLLQVGNGILPLGAEYNINDRADSTGGYYWLEAVDINAQSRWFGPVFPQFGFDGTNVEKESEVISALNNNSNGRREQTDKVDFLTPVTEKFYGENFQSAEAGLMTNDPNALKMEVSGRGIYRVDAPSLAAMGFNAAQSAYWKLFMGGVEQPIIVNPDGSMEFFGQGIDTLQTDANVYWLVKDTTTGKRISRISQKFVKSAKNGWSFVTAERKDKIYRVSSILNGARENWYGAVINGTTSNQTLNLSEIATESGLTATVGVDLQGLTAVSHYVSVLLNGTSIGQINFSLYDRATWTANVPLSMLVEGTNTLTLQSLGGSQDINITEAVRISYPRRLKAQNNRLDFGLDAGQTVKVRGFTNSQVRLWDVTNPSQIVETLPEAKVESDGTFSITIASASRPRVMLAVSDGVQLAAVSALLKNNPSDLKNAQNGAQFLVLAPHEYKKMLDDFCDLRTAGGIQTRFVDIEDVYDEFNNGVKSAEAIRAFLQFAKQNWSVKPDFAMFVGDATVDPRNYTGQGGYNNNRLPTMFVDTWNMETVSDEMMADFNNDGVGEIAVGRLPAKDELELGAMLYKISNAHPMTPQELTERGVHFVSDSPNGYDFATGSRNMATYVPSAVTVNYLDSAGQDPSVVRSNIMNRVSLGAAVVNYFGHASVGIWSNSQIFRNADAQNLTNTDRSAFIAMIDCLNGDFAETGIESLAEAVMKRSGGANAVWAASGYNGAYDQEFFAKDFYRKVFSGMPLGEAARQTKMLYPIADLRRTYIFFGDPSQPLVTP